MKKKIVFDSYALLSYLKKEDNYQKVKETLSSNDTLNLMNELNVGEVYYILARHKGLAQADYFIEVILKSLPIVVVANTFEMIIKASAIKAKYAISYMDCFAVAIAVTEQASILTGDPEFKKVQELVQIEWL